MFQARQPTRAHLSVFREELWKEQRALEITYDKTGVKCLRKHFSCGNERDAELWHLKLLRNIYPELVPNVQAISDSYIDLAYIEGSRIYNILEILKKLEAEGEHFREARRRLLERCIRITMRVQSAFVKHKSSECKRRIYPVQRKLLSLLEIFENSLAVDVNWDSIGAECAWAERYLVGLDCLVPFRDAAPKNLILAWPDVWRGRASAKDQEDLVRQAVFNWQSCGNSPLDDRPILNVDWSSCRELTTPEDDPISLILHEASWFEEMPSADQLLWQPFEPDLTRLSVALVVRMYRLGGRRLSYRLMHINGYKKRYEKEQADFYFRILVRRTEPYFSEIVSHFPALLHTTESILRRLEQGVITPDDWFEAQYGPQQSRYYRDVFPY